MNAYVLGASWEFLRESQYYAANIAEIDEVLRGQSLG